MIGTRRAIIAEFMGGSEIIAMVPWWAPDPTADELAALKDVYVMQGAGGGLPGDGDGVVTIRVTEHVRYFPEPMLTAAQQAALSGLP